MDYHVAGTRTNASAEFENRKRTTWSSGVGRGGATAKVDHFRIGTGIRSLDRSVIRSTTSLRRCWMGQSRSSASDRRRPKTSKETAAAGRRQVDDVAIGHCAATRCAASIGPASPSGSPGRRAAADLLGEGAGTGPCRATTDEEVKVIGEARNRGHRRPCGYGEIVPETVVAEPEPVVVRTAAQRSRTCCRPRHRDR